MKVKMIGKIFIVLLAILTVLPLSVYTSEAKDKPNKNAVPAYIQAIYRNGRSIIHQFN